MHRRSGSFDETREFSDATESNMRDALFGPVANTVHFITAVHPVHVRYRIKPILLYSYHSYIKYRSIPKPSVAIG